VDGAVGQRPSLLSYADINGDKVLQFSEIRMGPDLATPASPEIAGLPVRGVRFGGCWGLAAALSTADGLLLTIGNAVAHDMYFEGETGKEQAMRPGDVVEFALLVVALIAAYVAAQRPAGICDWLPPHFRWPRAAFVPAMVLGIFLGWSDAHRCRRRHGGGIGCHLGSTCCSTHWVTATFWLVTRRLVVWYSTGFGRDFWGSPPAW